MKPLSASQVELYRRCPRKWAFRYLTNLPRAQFTAATSLGTELHAANEAYNKSGTLPVGHKVNDLFMQGLPYLPKPKTGTSERRFDMRVDGIAYMGFQDWHGTWDGTPAVFDYKTSSDPAKYGLQGASDFLTHVQPLMYAREAVQNADTVYLRWIYYRTKGKPKAHAVSEVLRAGEVIDQFHKVVQAPAKEIVRLRVLPAFDPNELASNRDACNDFNTPCEYLAHCREDSITMAADNLLAELQDLCGDDTPAEAPKAADPINRTGRRVSSRPPMSDRGVFIEAVDPSTVKKAFVEPKTAETAAAPAPKAAYTPAPKNSTAIILEELSEALSRAAKRIS